MIRALRLCFAFVLLAVPAFAQTAATRATLYTEIDTLFADTGADPITPAQLRQSLKNITASSYNGLTDGVVSSTYQPLDSDLTAIAALTTTSHGRSFLAAANAAASATLAGVGTGDSPTFTGVFTTSNVGFGTATPLQRVHIKSNSATLPGVVAGNMAHDYYGLLVESEDAILGLASRNEGGHGSGIDFMEVNAGVLADKWYFGRLSSGFGSKIYWAYGTVADYASLTDIVLLTTTGGMSLPVVGSTMSIGSTTANGTLNLYGSGTETILIPTADGTDNHRLAISGSGQNSVTRGAYINLHGNEYSAQAGDVAILAGDSGVSGQGRIRFFTGTQSERAAFDKAGDLDFFTTTEATVGGDGSITTAGGIYAAKKIIATGGFTGALTGNVTGNLTGDVTGNVSGTSGSTTGNAATATALATPRTIGNVSFNGTAAIVPETIAIVDSTDSTSFPLMVDSATGSLQPKTDAGLTYNASTGLLTSTALTSGNLVLLGTSSGYTATAEHPLNIVPVSTASVGGAEGVRLSPELVATANSDTLYGTVVRSTLTSAGFTGLTTYNLFVNGQSLGGGGTLATAYQVYVAAGPTATARWGVYQVGASDQNYFAAPIDVGNADTTLARVSAGRISVEGVNVPTISSTDTLTNKTLTAPTLTGTITVTGSGGATIDNSSASAGTISSTGGGQFDITAPIQLSGNVKDSAGSFGTSGYALIGNGSGALTYQFIKRSMTLHFLCYPGTTSSSIGSTETFFGGNNRTVVQFDSTGFTKVRIRCHIGGTASNGTTTLSLKYYTTASTTLGDYLVPGASSTAVTATLNTTINATYTSGWIDLTAGAIGDVFWVLTVKDTANAAINPTFSSVDAEFR